jgi:predicted GH43/DUF377 family glycosyl hydrolase
VRAESVPIFTPANPNPGLEPSQSWEGSTILQASVIFDQGQYKAWYTAGSTANGIFNIGYATSNDGTTWTKYSGNPVLSKRPNTYSTTNWDSNSVAFPSVLKVSNQYYMYYRGSDGTTARIGLATSSDGITWTRSGSNPLIEGSHPNVVFAKNQWNMWYDMGTSVDSVRVYYATSADGLIWVQQQVNVIAVPSGRINAFAPSVVFAGGVFRMWFTTDNSTTLSLDVSRLFYATSTDGKSWNVNAADPLPSQINAGYASVVIGSTSFLWFNHAKGVYVATTTTPIPEFAVTSGNVPLILALTLVLGSAYFARRKAQKRLV